MNIELLARLKNNLAIQIQEYLLKVQGGVVGPPTMDELQFCAKLHQILEELDYARRRILP